MEPSKTAPHRKITMVTDDVPASAVGAMTYWRLAAATSADDLEAKWAEHDLRAEVGAPPEPPSPQVALARAVAEQKAKRKLVRPLAKAADGYAIVREAASDNGDLDYKVQLKVKLSETFKPVFDPPDHSDAAEIRDAYQKHIGLILSADLSTWLVGVMGRLEAVSLKSTGGIYFVPAEKMPILSKVVAAMGAVGSTVYEIPAMESEAATLAFVDALTAEIEAGVQTLTDELSKEDLGTRALENRANQIKQTLEKVEKYETLLGTSLSALRTQVETCGGMIAAAQLATS